jgi:hypothetical protein
VVSGYLFYLGGLVGFDEGDQKEKEKLRRQ